MHANEADIRQMTAAKAAGGKWRALSLLGMVPVVMVLNGSSVNIAISTLVRDLDTTVSGIQAVLALYALVMAVCMLPAAKLADRFGTKRIFPVGALLFGCGALVVALAQNGPMLLAGMALVQGLGASLMTPTGIALLSAAYPGEKRPGALAAYSAVASVTMAAAPILAGAVVTWLSWRLVFGFEALVVAAILLRLRILRGMTHRHRTRPPALTGRARCWRRARWLASSSARCWPRPTAGSSRCGPSPSAG